MIALKKMGGEVLYNDGKFAEIQTHGIEGPEEGLLLEILQAHIEDTTDTPEEFRQRFPVQKRLIVTTITEFISAGDKSERPEK
jgi:hypothetical protein